MLLHAKTRKATQGFTLIELLIVIGLLGAMTALVLPSLTADREEALGDICDYNQAGTVRVLKQYHSLFGVYPNDMHNGLDGVDSSAEAMPGLPDAQTGNMVDNIATTRHQLSDTECQSLSQAGINTICYDTGLNSTATSGSYVCELTNAWLDDTPAAYTFDGRDLADWCDTNDDSTADSSILVFWVAPTINWDTPEPDNANQDWTKGAVSLGLELEGQCPIPAQGLSASGDPEFSYYMGYFLVDNDASDGIAAAELIGTSCPECGVMNP